MLEAAQAAGLEPPFSCQAGHCGACCARLLKGTVQMQTWAALSDSEVEAGWILTCRAVATGEAVTITYDDGPE
ncbi:MAG: 2Fe-2S iron-sulfur cluster binding domain-containing protein [Acidobacteriota bacterium]